MYRNIDWDAITIKNNFLFQETLRNKSLCKQLLERVLHIQVKTIRYMETEKTMKAHDPLHGNGKNDEGSAEQ